ncbi:hypothetical protein [Provencibacterium massiliense]|uniref:hypothetical protein n=1 Tax=Provencibacterium massiliense TaxID=1841868 RepID=UPI0009A705BE|nr:hypothetical protein [Provencibacterium massiliense]
MTLSILIAAALCLIIFLLHRARLHKGRIEVQATIVKVIRTTHKEKDYYDPDGTYHPPISWTESTPIFAFTHAGKRCQVKGTEWDGLTVGEEKTIFWEPGSERIMLKEGKSVASLVLLLAADLLILSCALWGRLSGYPSLMGYFSAQPRQVAYWCLFFGAYCLLAFSYYFLLHYLPRLGAHREIGRITAVIRPKTRYEAQLTGQEQAIVPVQILGRMDLHPGDTLELLYHPARKRAYIRVSQGLKGMCACLSLIGAVFALPAGAFLLWFFGGL